MSQKSPKSPSNTGPAQAADSEALAMQVAAGKVVALIYSLKNSEGEILDEASGDEPFTYLHGAQQIVPGLESALEGSRVGDKKSVRVEPADGYGEVNPELKLVVNRSQFPAGAKLEQGMQFETQTPDGHGILFTVESVQGEKVHIDGNHPLAGETLHFDVEILQVRNATSEEVEHGHVHGEGGHLH
jgi:FKBP-type peptidyl-prolyl cis-trans isomerase SlyD